MSGVLPEYVNVCMTGTCHIHAEYIYIKHDESSIITEFANKKTKQVLKYDVLLFNIP